MACSRVKSGSRPISTSASSSASMVPLPSVSSSLKSSFASNADMLACSSVSSSIVLVDSPDSSAPSGSAMMRVREPMSRNRMTSEAVVVLLLSFGIVLRFDLVFLRCWSSLQVRVPSWSVSMRSKISRNLRRCLSSSARQRFASSCCATKRTFSTTMPATVFNSMIFVNMMKIMTKITKSGVSSNASRAMLGQFSSVANWKSVKSARGTVPNHSLNL
mmetsp:Transcript_150341/g.418921  ORF Transcript_150341/g.418921 Transcript_150341/m.418921 type:complete len:217 (+) Transcript_150341:170-820(+)